MRAHAGEAHSRSPLAVATWIDPGDPLLARIPAAAAAVAVQPTSVLVIDDGYTAAEVRAAHQVARPGADYAALIRALHATAR